MTDATPIPAAEPAQENVLRGTLLALLIIPVGVAVFTILLSFDILASITGFVIAIGAYFLYKIGAGRISVVGAIIVAVITIATAVIAWYFGQLWFMAAAIGVSIFDILGSPGLGEVLNAITAESISGLAAQDFWIGIGFAALGGAGVVAAAVKESRELDSSASTGAPEAPAA